MEVVVRLFATWMGGNSTTHGWNPPWVWYYQASQGNDLHEICIAECWGSTQTKGSYKRHEAGTATLLVYCMDETRRSVGINKSLKSRTAFSSQSQKYQFDSTDQLLNSVRDFTAELITIFLRFFHWEDLSLGPAFTFVLLKQFFKLFHKLSFKAPFH